jgi:hypothetical protein
MHGFLGLPFAGCLQCFSLRFCIHTIHIVSRTLRCEVVASRFLANGHGSGAAPSKAWSCLVRKVRACLLSKVELYAIITRSRRQARFVGGRLPSFAQPGADVPANIDTISIVYPLHGPRGLVQARHARVSHRSLGVFWTSTSAPPVMREQPLYVKLPNLRSLQSGLLCVSTSYR